MRAYTPIRLVFMLTSAILITGALYLLPASNAVAQSAVQVKIRAYNRLQKPIAGTTLTVAKTGIDDVVKGAAPAVNFANEGKCGMLKSMGAPTSALQQMNVHNDAMAVKLAEIISKRPMVKQCITTALGECTISGLPNGIYHITGVSHSANDIFVWNHPVLNTGAQNQEIILRPDVAYVNAPYCSP